MTNSLKYVCMCPVFNLLNGIRLQLLKQLYPAMTRLRWHKMMYKLFLLSLNAFAEFCPPPHTLPTPLHTPTLLVSRWWCCTVRSCCSSINVRRKSENIWTVQTIFQRNEWKDKANSEKWQNCKDVIKILISVLIIYLGFISPFHCNICIFVRALGSPPSLCLSLHFSRSLPSPCFFLHNFSFQLFYWSKAVELSCSRPPLSRSAGVCNCARVPVCGCVFTSIHATECRSFCHHIKFSYFNFLALQKSH